MSSFCKKIWLAPIHPLWSSSLVLQSFKPFLEVSISAASSFPKANEPNGRDSLILNKKEGTNNKKEEELFQPQLGVCLELENSSLSHLV
jgi:hypothetical protein